MSEITDQKLPALKVHMLFLVYFMLCAQAGIQFSYSYESSYTSNGRTTSYSSSSGRKPTRNNYIDPPKKYSTPKQKCPVCQKCGECPKCEQCPISKQVPPFLRKAIEKRACYFQNILKEIFPCRSGYLSYPIFQFPFERNFFPGQDLFS